MRLSESDTKLFYKLHWGLLFFANQKKPVIHGLDKPDFRGRGEENVHKLHDQLYQNPAWVDEFSTKNPFEFSPDELQIMKSWKNFIKDKFFLVEHCAEGTVFLKGEKEPKAFAVLGLIDDLEEMFPYLPVVAEAVLLPFKNKIIYSGLMRPYNMTFGGNFRRSLKADLAKAKSQFGLITSLDEPIDKRPDSDEGLFRFYCGTEENRFEYAQQIREMIEKHPDFAKIFSIVTAKSFARHCRKRFRDVGILPKTWVALFETVIVATGTSETEVRQNLARVLPAEKTEYVYVFQFK